MAKMTDRSDSVDRPVSDEADNGIGFGIRFESAIPR